MYRPRPQSKWEYDDDADWHRHSIKRHLARLCLCPLLGYGSSCEVCQCAYDLNLWSAIGAQRHLKLAPMRIMSACASFTPLYWQRIHFELVDLVKQLEVPKCFWTFSPSEWTMPYHNFVTDEMTRTLRQRLHLPVAETLHLTHFLLQVAKGFLLGQPGKHSK